MPTVACVALPQRKPAGAKPKLRPVGTGASKSTASKNTAAGSSANGRGAKRPTKPRRRSGAGGGSGAAAPAATAGNPRTRRRSGANSGAGAAGSGAGTGTGAGTGAGAGANGTPGNKARPPRRRSAAAKPAAKQNGTRRPARTAAPPAKPAGNSSDGSNKGGKGSASDRKGSRPRPRPTAGGRKPKAAADGKSSKGKGKGPRAFAELLVKELEKLLLWNREAGQPKDEATRVLIEATKLVEEMEMMRQRVDKGVSYNPSYAEKQFRKIIRPCKTVLHNAREELAKRAYKMTHRARHKLGKLVAHNDAAGAPDDDATAQIQVAEEAVQKAEAWEEKKNAAEDDDDEVTDAFIKAAHDAKLAVDAVGLAMRKRMKHELEEAEGKLHRSRDRVNAMLERNKAVGSPAGAATEAVEAALAAVEQAESAFEAMEDNPDTIELVSEFINSADAADAACGGAEEQLANREEQDYANAGAHEQELQAFLDNLRKLHARHKAYRLKHFPKSSAKGSPSKSKSHRRHGMWQAAGMPCLFFSGEGEGEGGAVLCIVCLASFFHVFVFFFLPALPLPHCNCTLSPESVVCLFVCLFVRLFVCLFVWPPCHSPTRHRCTWNHRRRGSQCCNGGCH